MCLLLLDICQLLITAGNLISSKCFQVPSDLATTCSKLNSGKARQALVRVPHPAGMGGPLMGLRSLLFKVNLLLSSSTFLLSSMSTAQTPSCTANSVSSIQTEDGQWNHKPGGPRAAFLLSLLDHESFSSSSGHRTSPRALASPCSGTSPGEHLNHQTKILTVGTALSSSRGGLKSYGHATFHDDGKIRQRSLDLPKEGKVQPWTWPKEGYFFSLAQPGHHSPRETFVRQCRIYNHNNPKSELALLLRHLYCW